VSQADLAGPEGASREARAAKTPLFDLVSDNGCPVSAAPDVSAGDSLYYWDYLHLDSLLNAQTPKSVEAGEAIHDEYFFIAVHQTYELWFKQILVELDSVMTIMGHERIPESELGTVVARLRRINAIQRLLVAQMDVLETLTPLDFLDFRSFLMPASGFQSVQFRLIENTFGLLERDRLKVEGHDYVTTLREDHADQVRLSELAPSLFDHVEGWLKRLPFVRGEGYDFAASYEQAATAMHASGRAWIESRSDLEPTLRRKQLESFEGSTRRFEVVFDKAGWAQEVRAGGRRFSHDAFLAALFISLYREDPVLQVPFQILETLIDIDETLTLWRQRHALMAHRMLGRLVGSAGSGYAYLDETAQRYTPFKDLFEVSTYLLPRVDRPPLPESPLPRPADGAW
jgi:tryptophan 2,3-dioxygenase